MGRPETYRYTVTRNNAGLRLDHYVVSALPKDISRTRVQRLITAGDILINGVAHKCHYKLAEGDIVDITITPPEPVDLKPERIPLRIVHEDDRIIVVDKPAGMVVHPAVGNMSGTLVNALLYHTARLAQGEAGRPGLVHRLDKNTSGLIVVAKDEAAHAYLARQFSRRQVDKIYVAVVEGVMRLDNGVIDADMGRHPRDRQRMAVLREGGKPASTSYRVIKRLRAHTVVEFSPDTGRTHQIRVHAAHIGHPVVADDTYGKTGRGLIGRHALHARSLSFRHPGTRQTVSFDSPLPLDMESLISGLGAGNGRS